MLALRNPSDFSLEQWGDLERSIRLSIARAAVAAGDMLSWGAAIFPEKFPLEFCYALHQYIIDVAMEEFTSTKAPRYHSKTTVSCFLVPMYLGIYHPTLFRHYLQVQANQDKAVAANRSIKVEFEENVLLRALVGNMKGSRWTDGQFTLSNGVCYSAVGAGQSIRGLNYRNMRPDFIMPDDLYDEDDIHNPEAIEKKDAWFWSTLYPARAQGRRTAIHVTGTAFSKLDIYSRLEKIDYVKSKTFQAIIGPWENKQVLWPEKNTFESLMRDKELMTNSIFMREMQNEPLDDSASLVKLAWIKGYDPDQLAPAGTFQYVGCYLGADPSIGEKEENDFAAFVLIYVYRYTDGRGYFYYIDQMWNEHLSLDKRVKLLQDIQDRQPEHRKITMAFIEGIAGFKDFVAEVRRRTNIPVRQIPEPGKKIMDKLANLEVKAWFFENGRVFLNKNIDPKLKDNWKYQMCNNHPRYDDLRDATLMPLELIKADALGYMD